MARQPGARTQVAFAFESVYGTPPASGYRRMPFATTTLGSEQGLLSPELLGYGRDPQAPIRDAVNVDGDVVIPMDAENLGFWLKAIFGQPTTTGTTPRTHTFQSGGFTLPSMAIETQMPDVPRFAMYSGLVADRIQWQSQRSGLLTATAPDWMRGQPLTAKRKEIDRWHREERGWRKIGYHHLIDRDGAILPGRVETEIGAGVEGHNRGVIHICLIGGAGSAATDPFERHFTTAQDRALRGLIDAIRAETAITRITGHNDHAAKACPGFVVRTWINRA